MLIEPNTNIRILKGVPIDNSYQNTLYFGSDSAQQTYFSGKTKFVLREQSYQRVSRGIMRVEVETEKLYDCNYLMFQNRAFGTKWFYAFIIDVQYINNITSQITYEIDDMQTWAFDYELKQCYVEREHVTDDSIGANLVPENFSLPRYKTADKLIKFFDSWDVSIVYTTNEVSGVTRGNYYIPYHVSVRYPLSNPSAINEYLQFLISQNATILGIYQVPRGFGSTADGWGESMDVPNVGTSLNGYIPKNNKLFTYPFNYLECTINGTTQQYRYEWFENPNLPKFLKLANSAVIPFSFGFIPIRYAGDENTNLEFGIVNSDMPQSAWSEEAYDRFIAQKKDSHNFQMLSTALTSSMNALTSMMGTQFAKNPEQARRSTGLSSAGNIATSLVGQELDYQAQIIEAKNTPPTVNGSVNGDFTVVTGYYGYMFKRKALDIITASRIDNIFDKIGYAVKEVKVPNIHSRPHWNYVQTNGCTIKGEMPSSAIKHICAIFDKGITFWKHPEEVGNYDLDNRIY